MIRTLVAIAIVLACVARADADTRRVAVVVGNNVGHHARQALRYAERDAAKVSRVLVELGGVAPSDLFLLQGKDRAMLDATLRRANAQVAAYKRARDRVIVIFYYSGHSDGVALELGRERFAFAELRRWLEDTGADVRLALVDSCKSGALLATKGGAPGPAFSIRLTDELSSTGEAVLTSSAADENALESREIGGSFFTHHLVSGLRGGADASGDARVTLTEAYQYAYRHTISTSSATLAGPQHPAYDYKLSGRGELVLTELARPTAGVVLPAGFDRALVFELDRDQVIAELGRGDPPHVAVVPGRYRVRAWRGRAAVEATLAVAAHQRRAVRWDELRPAGVVASRAKGDVAATYEPGDRHEARALAFAFGIGARAGVAEPIDGLGALRIGVRSAPRGPSLALDVATRGAGGLRESSVLAFAGYRAGIARARFEAHLGIELGGGIVTQSLGDTATTGALALAPVAGASYRLAGPVALGVEAQVPATLLKLDGGVTLVTMPAAWISLIFER